MGVVYLAREVSLDRPVAIKVLPPARAKDTRLKDRFLREARTAAKLSHPNIVAVHTVGEVADFVFFAMAFIEGQTLTERVRSRGPLTPSDAARVLREVAWALAYAHSSGVVHRDVKPDNIMIETAGGRALVTDFGIAGRATGAAGLEGEAVEGTPEFMSPEQALGRPIDGRSDLYSFGATAYFALTRRFPFEGNTAAEVIAKQVSEPVPSFGAAALVPRRLAALVERCLAKDPGERPATAADVAERLGQTVEIQRELPVPLRVFVKRSTKFSLLVTVASVWAASFTAAMAASAVAGPLRPLVALGTFVGTAMLIPIATMINRSRKVLKAGFTREDALHALRGDLERTREERVFEFGATPSASLYERLTRTLGLAGLGSGLTLTVLGAAGSPVMGGLVVALLLGGGLGTVLWLYRLSQRRDIGQEITHWFWRGGLGRWIFARAGLGLKRGDLVASFTHRPTELALGLAAEELFQGLPKDVKARLADVPSVVGRLQEDAARMRGRLGVLRDALGDDPLRDEGEDPRRLQVRHDLNDERQAVERRLHDAVAALETLRLGLLRLHAGTGSVQSVTTDLGLALDVAADVDRLLEARKELEDGI